jgi:hypothetical protein
MMLCSARRLRGRHDHDWHGCWGRRGRVNWDLNTLIILLVLLVMKGVCACLILLLLLGMRVLSRCTCAAGGASYCTKKLQGSAEPLSLGAKRAELRPARLSAADTEQRPVVKVQQAAG